MSDKYPFLGTGWGFPPEFRKTGPPVVMSSDEADIEKSLEILFSTSLGERIMEPTYGCDLKRLLFEPMDLSLKAYIKDIIKTAVLYHEPRIVLEDLRLDTREDAGALEITLDFTIRATNSRRNFVYPFYLTERSAPLR